MRSLGIQNISSKTLLYEYPSNSKHYTFLLHILGTQNIRSKIYYMHILGTENISSKTLLYAYSRYSKHYL